MNWCWASLRFNICNDRPQELPTKLRARLGAAGIGADIVDNPVERLSGGQKARLLMTIAAIDAPHILILDEPTNHLDIESREALVHALNSFGDVSFLSAMMRIWSKWLPIVCGWWKKAMFLLLKAT